MPDNWLEPTHVLMREVAGNKIIRIAGVSRWLAFMLTRYSE